MAELPEKIEFLTLDDVRRLHAEALARFGGQDGIRDHGGLQSALTMPRQAFGGSFVHADLAEMSAAYLFHIAESQAFFDGNKRTGVAAAVVFLAMNNVRLEADEMELYRLTLAIAERDDSRRARKADVADYLRKHMTGMD